MAKQNPFYLLQPFTPNATNSLLQTNPTSQKQITLQLMEQTHSLLQFKVTINENTIYLKITPDLLSVDKLQYYINNKKLKIEPGTKSINYYIQLDENTIILEILKPFYSRIGNSNDLIDVYESRDIDIERYKGDKFNNVYEENLKNFAKAIFVIFIKQYNIQPQLEHYAIIQEDIKWLKELSDDLNKSFTIKSTDNISKSTDTTFKNIDVFLDLSLQEYKNKDFIKFNCIDLNVYNFDQLIFDNKDNEGNTLIIEGEEYVIIGYPDQVMKSYLELYHKEKEVFDEIHKDHKDKFMRYMSQMHNFIPEITDKINIEQLDTEIHKFYDYEKYYLYLENSLKDLTPEQMKLYTNNNTLNKSKSKSKSNNNRNINSKTIESIFHNKLKELQKEFYNSLAQKCLNKPIIQIQYVFLIFKKHSNGNYVPAIFNFRELKHKHHLILKRIEILIKTILPKIYGIDNQEYKLWYSYYNYGDVFHIKTKYIHSMSNIHQQAYKYKNSITLEEIIYMLNIPQVDLVNLKLEYQKQKIRFRFINGARNPQHYGNSKDSNTNNNNINKVLQKSTQNLPYNNTIKKNVKKNKNEKSTRKQTGFTCREIKIDEEILDIDSFIDLINGNGNGNGNIKIVLMFVEIGYIYNFIYKILNPNETSTFYILKISPNLCNIQRYIQKYFEHNPTIIPNEPNKDKTTISLNIPNINLYKVVKHRLLSQLDYKQIMRYNPLLVRTIKQQNIVDKFISICSFFQTPILKIEEVKCNKIFNPYIKKPFLIRNILASDIYKREFEIFKKQINVNAVNSNNYYAYRPKDKTDENIIDIIDEKYQYSLYEGENNIIKINRIYFNPNNCGYNLIDIYEKLNSGDFKSVIWCVPLNATLNEQLNERPDQIFKKVKYIGNYLGNFISLNNYHINMINQIKQNYITKDTFCNVNIQSKSPSNFCLHVHILKTQNYKRNFSYFEQGSRIYAMLKLTTILNNISLFHDYYNNLDIDIILHNDN